MIRGDRLQLSVLDHEIDWQAANKAIRPGRHHVVIEMVPPPESKNGILLPDRIKEEIRADVGVVLASPATPLEIKGRQCFYPEPGSMVCVFPEDGTWIEDAEMGDYKPKSQVRVYGVWCEIPGEPHIADWWQSIVCEIDPETQMLKPYMDKVIVRLDSRKDATDSGIFLSDNARPLNGMGVVESVGSLIDDVRPGDRVCVDLNAIRANSLTVDLSETHKGLAVCDQSAILYVAA